MNFYWEGDEFSYLHYLSLKSFVDLNPDWTTRMYTPKVVSTRPTDWATPEQKTPFTGENYFSKVKDLGVEIITIDLDEFLGFDTSLIHRVQKSDLFRWKLLAEMGGGWSDSDILYTKPLSALLTHHAGPALGNFKTRDPDETTAVIPYYHSLHHTGDSVWGEPLALINQLVQPIGFFLASPESPYFKAIYDLLQSERRSSPQDGVEYQWYGIRLLERLHTSISEILTTYPGTVNVGDYPFYAYHWDELNLLFDELDDRCNHPDVIGIHWFNGGEAAVKFKNYLNEETINDEPSCTMHLLAQKALLRNES